MQTLMTPCRHEHHQIGAYAKAGKVDPTHTTTLRNAFAREMKSRYLTLARAIKKAVDEQDCFGLKRGDILSMVNVTLPGELAFAFPRSSQKVAAFMSWFDRQEKLYLESKGLWSEGIELITAPQLGIGVEDVWTNKYVYSAYQQGIFRARRELQKSGYKVPSIAESGGLGVAMNQPMHIDRLGLVYSRTYEELKGINASMSSQISRVLSQGMAEGRNPRELAIILASTVMGPVGGLGITDTLGRFIPAARRAEIMARTEIIRAHHVATIQEYRNWGLEGVQVQGEWATAGDDRVCDECAELHGKVFPLDEIESMIPVHPQCRCIALPVEVKEDGEAITSGEEELGPLDFPGGDLGTGWEETTMTIEGKEMRFYRNPNYNPAKGSSIYYHDTMPRSVPLVAKGGLDPYETQRGQIWANSAVTFKAGIKGSPGFYSGDVIVFSVPAKEWKALRLMEVVSGQGTIFYDRIPPQYIKGFLRDYKPNLVSQAKLAKIAPPGVGKVVAPSISRQWKILSDYTELEETFSKQLRIYGINAEQYTMKARMDILNSLGSHFMGVLDNYPGLMKMVVEAEYDKGIRFFEIVKGRAIRAGNIAGEYFASKRSMELAGGLSKTIPIPTIGRKTWDVGKDFFTLFRHEYGHHVQTIMERTFKSEWATLFRERGEAWFAANVSRYGGSNYQEAFAECFAAYTSPRYGEATRKLPAEIEDFFRRLLG